MTFAARTLNSTSAGGGGGGGGSTVYTGTITQGFYYDGSFFSYYGFDTDLYTGVPFGSRSPTTVRGYAFDTLIDIWVGSTPYNSVLSVIGFSSDPGIDFITSVTVGSVFQQPSSYSYSGGQAIWSFPSTFGMTSTGSVACVMTGI